MKNFNVKNVKDVKEVLKESYIYLFDNYETFGKKTGLVLAFFFASSFLYELLPESMDYSGSVASQILRGSGTSGQLLWFVLHLATTILFGLMINSNIMRAKLKNDFSDPGILGVHWHRDVTVIAFAAIVPFAITAVTIFLSWPMIWLYAAGDGAAFVTIVLLTGLMIAGVSGGTYFFVRMFLLIPIAFTAQDISKTQITEAWKMTDGNFSSIFMTIIGMILPVAVMAFVIKIFIQILFAGLGFEYLSFILSSIVTAINALYNVAATSVLQATLYKKLEGRK